MRSNKYSGQTVLLDVASGPAILALSGGFVLLIVLFVGVCVYTAVLLVKKAAAKKRQTASAAAAQPAEKQIKEAEDGSARQ
ncbi:MAG: hypothetical protein VB092_00635 [Oscillospiraceae bacterium]|nr:hypothetical protein [Oscillospiraceae bacterium]